MCLNIDLKKQLDNNLMSQYATSSRSKLLMSSLEVFFKEDSNLKKIIPIINGESKISLRVIDWFVTNYSKKFNTSYFINTIFSSDIKN